ncbi:MAG TPA: endolytic transglycosylase MltG [Woeseiaceae bacterium]|nr:endolytic transglycosylase MltG [Woeseiaceae bacterium]
MIFKNIKPLTIGMTLIVFLFVYAFYSALSAPIKLQSQSVFFEIDSGDTYKKVIDKLKNQGLINETHWLNLYGRLANTSTKIKAGEYLLKDNDNLLSIIDRFVIGDVYLHPFTIIEGWTKSDLLAKVNESSLFSKTDVNYNWTVYLEGITDKRVIDNPEGLFLPETYFFPKSTPVKSVFDLSNKMMLKALKDEWENRDPDLPLNSPYEGLILASIIEKETAITDERPRIASVFIERLKKNMRLQTDPTVIYGLGENFNGNLTKKNIRSDTEYNTYTRNGLPPTPIALPSRDSIHATFHPSKEKNIYFVATGDNDGRHKFSHTKEEHDIAVKEYLYKMKFNTVKENKE